MPNPDHVALARSGAAGISAWIADQGFALPRFDLSYSDLTSTDLAGAVLCGSDFRGADLRGANLTAADLRGALFCRTNLARANLSQSICWGTVFADLELSTTIGLDTILHCGPSSIDLSTIRQSHVELPRDFLMACGASDRIISRIAGLRLGDDEDDLPSCFISYSDLDREFATLLHHRLQGAGVRCYFAPEDIRGGRPLLDQLACALHEHDRVLLVLSRGSIRSEWVKNEIVRARRRERSEGRRILWPICIESLRVLDQWECLDPVTGEDIALSLRGYFIPDFSEWRNAPSFDAVLRRLLADLKSS